ncbi:MAG TPA: FAD-dependent oxidoreductase [Streptosporangiaceae bacterium]|nr:FAD-dependent oxidoreductase [Streptosporangiaceae bacterium]
MADPPAGQAHVIIGASLAGAKAAETLRGEGFTGPVVLIGDEPERPYERPPLSKEYLRGKSDKSAIFVHEEHWYREHDVDLRLGLLATAVDSAAKRVELTDGTSIGYERLLLTTGAAPRRLAVPGSELDCVMYLRTVSDSERIATALAGNSRVVIVGAGWIGLEVAAAAREKDCAVTVVEPESVALKNAIGPELGAVFADLHVEHGVTFRFGETVREIRGAGGRVSTVVTSAGAELEVDAVIVGIGAAPNVDLAVAAGLAVDNGILVDAALRTSAPGVFAAGDVANAINPLLGKRVRVEHWSNALHSGPAAARSMLGQDVVFDRVPYFYSDQYDLGMECSGLPTPGSYGEIVYRGDVPGREFIAFWLDGGRVLAGMNVNVWDVTGDIQALIRAGYAGATVDPARLADPAVPLADLAS